MKITRAKAMIASTLAIWQATVDAGNSNQCLNAIHLQDGSLINAIGCKSKSPPGWWDQYWKVA